MSIFRSFVVVLFFHLVYMLNTSGTATMLPNAKLRRLTGVKLNMTLVVPSPFLAL